MVAVAVAVVVERAAAVVAVVAVVAVAAEVRVLAARWGSVALARQAEHRDCSESRDQPGMRSQTETGMP